MRFSLHNKVLISLIGLFVVCLAIMGSVLLHDADQRMEDFRLFQAKAQVRTLADSSEESLLVRDYPTLENLVTVAKSEEQYAYAAIVSPVGLVFSHSDLKMVGSTIRTVDQNEGVNISQTTYLNRPIREIIYPVISTGKHLANAHIAYFTDEDTGLSNDTIRWLVEVLMLTLVLLSLGSLIITKYFTRPIAELTKLVKQDHADFRINVDREFLDRSDEIGALAVAFKNMSDQLVDRVEELEVQIQARDSARAASETKSAFLTNISHELKTPLTAIIGFSELLMENARETENTEAEDDLQKIKKSAEHLVNLINDMLDLSKIEAGKMKLSLENIAPSSIIGEVQGAMQDLIDRSRNRLVINYMDQNCKVIADSTRLKQIIINLVSNAVKFTKDGEITLTVQSVGGNVLFSVADTGIGMSEDQLDTIFDAFVQAHKNKARLYGGTGLGLAISKSLCEQMGGKLVAKSKLGEGSEFLVILPLADHMQNVASN